MSTPRRPRQRHPRKKSCTTAFFTTRVCLRVSQGEHLEVLVFSSKKKRQPPVFSPPPPPAAKEEPQAGLPAATEALIEAIVNQLSQPGGN